MHRPPVLALVLLTLAGCARPAVQPEQGATTLLLFRHAEKVDDSRDPALNEAGQLRAEALREALGGAGVDAIVVSQFRRTAETAQPLAAALGLEAQPRALEGDDTKGAAHTLARQLAEEYAGRTVLVVGHSNTVPAMLGALTGVEPPELEGYGDLFVVTLPPGGGAARVIHARVGA